MQKFNFLCNSISLFAALITIWAAINSCKMLSALDKYKKDLYGKQRNKSILNIIKKIKADIKENLGTNQNAYNSVQLIKYLEILIEDDRQLQDKSKCFFSVLKDIKKIRRDNVEYFLKNVNAILDMYNKGN